MAEFIVSAVSGTGTSKSCAGVTLSGSNRYLVAFVWGGSTAPSSVTFDSVGMTLLNTINISVIYKLYVYGLDEPNTTSNAILTANFAASTFIVVGGLAYSDIDSVRNNSSATGSSTSLSHNATTVSGDIVVSAGALLHTWTNPCADTDTYTYQVDPNAGQTEKTDYNSFSILSADNGSGVGLSISYELASGTSTSSGYGHTGTLNGGCLDPETFYWAVSAVVLIPSASGGVSESVSPGALRLTGYAPLTSLFGGHISEPITFSQLRLTGVAPDYSISGGAGSISEPIPNGALRLTGLAPATWLFGGHSSEPIPASNIRLTGFAPTVVNSGSGTTLTNPNAINVVYNGWTATVDVNL